MFYKDERLALFIDGSNMYAAAKALEFDIDYKLLRQEFMRRGKLLRAFYYTALLENDDYSPIRPLVDWLNYNGEPDNIFSQDNLYSTNNPNGTFINPNTTIIEPSRRFNSQKTNFAGYISNEVKLSLTLGKSCILSI